MSQRKLAKQEMRVARMLVAGLRQPEIAQRLGIAASTVKTHVARIQSKTGFDRHSFELALPVFLYKLLEDQEPRQPRRGAELISLLLQLAEPSGILTDAVLLLNGGYRDLTFHQAYVHGGREFTEWMNRDGVIATVREHGVLSLHGLEIPLSVA